MHDGASAKQAIKFNHRLDAGEILSALDDGTLILGDGNRALPSDLFDEIAAIKVIER